jgi:hypothetical protein
LEFFGPQTLDLQDNHLRSRIVNKQTVGVMLAVFGLFVLNASSNRDGMLMAALLGSGLAVIGLGLWLARSLFKDDTGGNTGRSPRGRK